MRTTRYFLFHLTALAMLSLGTTSCEFNFGEEEPESWNGSTIYDPNNPGGVSVDHSAYEVNGNEATYMRSEAPERTSVVILEAVTINGKSYPVTAIAENAFSSHIQLTSVTLPSSLKTIGKFAFANCGKLASVTLPTGLVTIDEGAFFECKALTSITIPKGVTKLSDGVFANNANLKEVKCLATNPPAFNSEWSGFDWELTENGKLLVPAASVDAYKAANGWKEFKNISGI